MNNIVLKNKMELLSKKAFYAYNKNIQLEDPDKNLISFYMKIRKSDGAIKNLPEFKECAAVMTSEPKIKEILGKTVGTQDHGIIVENEDVAILGFLQKLYYKKKLFETSFFEEQYSYFEDLFYSSTLKFRETSRLYDFKFDGTEIVLEAALKIVKDPVKSDSQLDLDEIMQYDHRKLRESDFFIERFHDRDKIVGNVNSLSNDDSSDLFDLIIRSLRLLKSSSVYRDNSIQSEMITFHPHVGTLIVISHFENTSIGKPCHLSLAESTEFCATFNKLKTVTNKRFNIALGRLCFGVERKTMEDKLIDYVIGLESLYLPDSNDELTFKLASRVSFMLNRDNDKRKNDFEFVKKMYHLRSKVIHGDTCELSYDDISHTESILRDSLKKYLVVESNFSKEYLNKIYFM